MSAVETAATPRVAIVTGAADGLGLAIAARLLRDGYRVVASDISPPSPVLTADRHADRLHAAVVDATDPLSGTTLVDLAMGVFGRLDAVVNNAGVGGPGALVEDLVIDDIRQVFEVNVLGTVRLSQAAIPYLKAQGSGNIVNLGSVFADEPVPEGSAYCMSKAAIKSFTQCLALELGQSGIRVNAVAPGYMLTKMHLDEISLQAERLGVTPDHHRGILRESVPLRRHGTGDDVANVVSWLLSADASYVTGQTIGVNGGISFN
jgi:NAD(P)-dependent dehydrogenase (short-subunit alcohol dehydrogenase family)